MFQVERINAMINELLETKRLFEEDRQKAQEAYEAKIEEMRLQYEQVRPTRTLIVKPKCDFIQ